jgi:sugar phosphate isomerase/epimerase
MSDLSRREFFKKTGAGAAALTLMAAKVAELKANPLGLPIGSQTYPHRLRIQCGDFAGLLKDMKGIGIDVIELCNPTYREFASLADGKATRKILDDNGMKAVSAHFGMGSLRTDQQKQIDWALETGMVMMSTADLGGRVVNGVTTEDEVKRAAYEYNKIAENAKRNGLQQILHNETFADSRLEDGRLTYPVLLEYLDSDLVKMQFQMSSMPTIGSPITYFMNHPGRFMSAHLQGVDAAAGMRAAGPGMLPTKSEGGAGGRGGRGGAGRGGRGPATDPCAAQPAAAGGAAAAAGRAALPGNPGLALGEDSVDWPAVFAAGKVGGLKYAFVEQTWDLTAKSVAYLKTLS